MIWDSWLYHSMGPRGENITHISLSRPPGAEVGWDGCGGLGRVEISVYYRVDIYIYT